METFTKLILLSPLVLALYACGGGGEVADTQDSVGTPTTPVPTTPTTPVTPPSTEEAVNAAITQIESPESSVSSCSNVALSCAADGSSSGDLGCSYAVTVCESEKDAYIESVYANVSGLVDVSLESLTEAIEYGLDFAKGLGDSLSDMEIVYTSPDTATGQQLDISQVTIPRPDQISADAITPMLSDNAGIPADEEKAAQAPNGEAGWYYRNSENGKINWYFYGDFGAYSTSYTIADLQSLTARVKHYTDTGYYFFNVYTETQGDGNDRSSWYRSRLNLVADTSTVVADQTFLGHFERTATVHDTTGHLPIYLGSNSRLSTGATTIDDINTERLKLISFSTASQHPEGWAHFLLKEITLGLGNDVISFLPVAFPEPEYSDDILNTVLNGAGVTTAYLEITSATELFNELEFDINEYEGSWSITQTDDSQLTSAMEVLLEKLDKGNGKNALSPSVSFDPGTNLLRIDIGSALSLADIANLTATIYTDNTKTTTLATITIDADGLTVTVI